MRRAECQMADEDVVQVLQRADHGFLGTVGPALTGPALTPYVVPVNYCYYEGQIIFHCAQEGLKMDNIRANERVCFTVCTEHVVIEREFTTRYESVIVFGRAEIAEDRERKRELLCRLVDRLAPGRPFPCPDEDIDRTGVVCITIEQATGKRRIG